MFVARFQEIARATGWRSPVTPYRAMEAWAEFVDDCRDGYPATLFEYMDDLSVRRFLQAVVNDPVIRRCPEATWFGAELARTDARFRELLADGLDVPGGGGPWWERAIPGRGGEEMAATARELLGLEIDVV
ncbi:hypothetical protein ACWCXE_05990 [Streptomyces sp. NPDC001780]